jgi:hypothetical protein
METTMMELIKRFEEANKNCEFSIAILNEWNIIR